MKEKVRFIIGAILLIFVIVIYSYQLYFPDEMYYDEVYHVKRAVLLAELHQYPHRVSTHPPLWHLFSALCITMFGNSSFAWRVPSLVSGLILIFLTYKLTKKITKNVTAAYLAAFLFTFDCISLTQARIAMLNSMKLMFMLLALFSFLEYYFDRNWKRRKAFIWTGVFLGFALAVKLSASLMYIIFISLIISNLASSRKDYLSTIRESALYIGLLPIAIFIGAHLFIPFLEDNSWQDISRHILYNFRSFTVSKGHNYGSAWWSWPIISRPIWYFYEESQNIVRGVLCMGNQAIFWPMPLSIGWTTYSFFKRKSKDIGLISLAFFSLWLPWAFVARVKFFHYIYSAMPFVCMSIALLLSKVWQKGRLGKVAVCLYLILVIIIFVYWYPLLTGMPISHQYYRHHMWFRSWI